jgi:hypothetical protein
MELLGQNGGNGLSYISHSDDFGKGSFIHFKVWIRFTNKWEF